MRNNYNEKVEKEIDLLLSRAWDLIRTDVKEALNIVKKAEKLSRKLKYEEGIALSTILLARYNSMQGKYAEALQLASEGNELAISLGFVQGQINASYVLGYLYTDSGNLEVGLKSYLRALELMKENNQEIDPFILNNIGVVYDNSGQADEALEFFQEAIKIVKKTEYSFQSLLLFNIANMYLRKKDTETAQKYCEQAFSILETNHAEKHDFAQYYSILGVIYKEMNQLSKALENYQIALSLYQESNKKYAEIDMLNEIGVTYLKQNNNEESIKYLKSAMKEAKKINANGLLKDIYMTLAETYEKKRDYKLAFNYLKLFNELNEKIKTTELNDKLVQHMTEFKVEKAQKDAEIQRLKTEELKRKAEETTLKANALAASYEDIKIIGEIGQKITATLDIKKVLNMVYKNINKLMAADVFGICLYNKEQGSIDFKILIEQGKRLPLHQVMIDNEKSYAAKCIREKKEICINDMILDNKQQLRVGATENKFKCKSIIYYPLITEDKIVGAMTVQSYKNNAYSDRSIGMIKALASYIAIALNNSQKSEELRVKTNELEAISKTDVLTGIYNRRYIMSKIEEEAVAYKDVKRTFSIVIIDIDYFKSINDKYGHNCGDHILVKLSKILKANIRKQDVLSRWGGEEFLMLLPDTNEEEAVLICEFIREKIEGSNFNYEKKRIKLTVTFGVSEYNENLGVDSTINDADKALYEGKNKGRNCVVSH
ncbi:sensor domain-containing diguanylate cyclase [Clostridium sp. UBA4548]|uniref:sensor domain-containing diguanylate cyclase n=1 Tax=Clostridium sp. UBA4548 TaxID=1946361 RepID=UPI0025C540F1|nr:diguanylate cyclase [Clostridium sp. UBA4548]